MELGFEVREDTPPKTFGDERAPATVVRATQAQKRRRVRAVKSAAQQLVLPLRKQGGREVLPFSLQFVGDGYVVSELSSVLTIRGSGARAVGRAPSGGAGVRIGDELLRCNGVSVHGQRAAAKLAKAIGGVLDGIPEGGTAQVAWQFRQAAAGLGSRAERQESLYQRRLQAATDTTDLVFEPALLPCGRSAAKWHRLCARALVRMRRALPRPCVAPKRIAKRSGVADTSLLKPRDTTRPGSPSSSSDSLEAALEAQAALIGLSRSNSSYTHQSLSDSELLTMQTPVDSEDDETAVAAVFRAASVEVAEKDLAGVRPSKQREPEPEPELEPEPEQEAEAEAESESESDLESEADPEPDAFAGPKYASSPSGRSPRYPTQAEWAAAHASSTSGSTLSIIDTPFPKQQSWEGLPSRFPTLTEWISAEDRAAEEQQLLRQGHESAAAANERTPGTAAAHLPPSRVASLPTPRTRGGTISRAGKHRSTRSSSKTDTGNSSDSDDSKGTGWTRAAAAVPRVASEGVPPPSPRKEVSAVETSSIHKPTRASSWRGLDSSNRSVAAANVITQSNNPAVVSASSAPVNDSSMAAAGRRNQKKHPMAELSWWWGGGPIDEDEDRSPPRLPAAVFSPLRQQKEILVSLKTRSYSSQDVSSAANSGAATSPPGLRIRLSNAHPSTDTFHPVAESEASTRVAAPAAQLAAAAAAKATAVAALEAELESMRASHAETVAEQTFHQNAHNLAVAEQHEQQKALEAVRMALEAEQAVATAQEAQAAADAAADATRALLESQSLPGAATPGSARVSSRQLQPDIVDPVSFLRSRHDPPKLTAAEEPDRKAVLQAHAEREAAEKQRRAAAIKGIAKHTQNDEEGQVEGMPTEAPQPEPEPETPDGI